ncbi:MAG: radical SAM protein [Actinobacteria bacterium]|nr:radical SAM protein [Actinomycetota bacterium]
MPEPLALEMVAAYAPDHEIRILDLRIEDDLPGVLADFAPELVGTTALTPEVYAAREVLKTTKDICPDAFTVIGGHHATLLPQDFFLPQVDAVALGEGEMVFEQLVRALDEGRNLSSVPNLIWRQNGNFIGNKPAATKINLDTLPLPRHDLVKQYRNEYFMLFDKPDSSVSTGRGCPYKCNFCSVWKFYDGKVRQMSAQRVVKEILAVETEHITFVDDNFLLNHARESEIVDLIRAEGVQKRYSMQCRSDSIARHPELVAKWGEIGLYGVLLGLEGASDRMLNKVDKKNTITANDEAIRILHDQGIIIWGAFIVDPNWTEDDFKRLRDYVTEKQITHTQFTVLTPLPGTKLYQQCNKELLTEDYKCFDTLHSVLPTRLGREEFYRHFAGLYQQTDLGPYWDLVREGKLSIQDCKRGRDMLEIMSRAELYHCNDPILGRRQAGLPTSSPE